MKLYFSSDHAGFELKNFLVKQFTAKKLNVKNKPSLVLEVVDLGPDKYESNDGYPMYAKKLAKEVLNDQSAFGVMICGTGQGSAMTLNRFKDIRAAVCVTQKMAKLAREHNQANVLCLGARLIGKKKASAIVRSFLRSQFQGGRHQERVEQIN